MGNRRAKQRKDAIAQGLRDIAFIAMDGVHHELQAGSMMAPGFFGIEIFDQGRRAFDIGKQSGDGLALAIGSTARFHCRLLGQNTFGEMLAVCSLLGAGG